MGEQFQNEIHQMQKDMRQLDGKVDKILNVLSGSEIDKNDKGLVGDVRALEERVEKLERWKERVIYLIIGLSFGAGWGFSDLILKVIHK